MHLGCNKLAITLWRKKQVRHNDKDRYCIMRKNFLVLGAVGLALLASCQGGGGRPDAHAEGAQGSDAKAQAHAGEIVLPHDKAKAAGVVVRKVGPGDFYGVIPVGGKVMEATGREATVVATASGVVSLLSPMAEGTAVAAGKPLFAISGERLQDGDPAERARIAYQKAKREYERMVKLVADKIVSDKEYTAAKADYENARIAYEAISRSGASGTRVASPLSGYVKSCLVKEGDYVAVGQPLASITQNRRLYLKADVPERYYKQLAHVSSAKFRTSYSDDIHDIRELGGRLVAIGRASAEASPYIPVTFEFNNTGGILPGAFAEVYLLTAKRSGVISLPLGAITEEQGAHFVYIQTDADCYRKQEVTLGEADGEAVEVCRGLKGGEPVVVEGAIHVKLASASNAIPAHTHSH